MWRIPHIIERALKHQHEASERGVRCSCALWGQERQAKWMKETAPPEPKDFIKDNKATPALAANGSCGMAGGGGAKEGGGGLRTWAHDGMASLIACKALSSCYSTGEGSCRLSPQVLHRVFENHV